MAAGRLDVSRRRNSYGYSKKEYDNYRNGTRGVESIRGRDQGVRRKNGCHILSSLRNLDRGQGELSGRNKEREVFEVCIEGSFDDAPWVENGEDEVQLPPDKRRKFSPIIWDIEEKEVRISPEKGIVHTSTSLSPPKSFGGVVNVVSDGGVVEFPVLENQVRGLELSSGKLPAACGLAETTVSESPANFCPPMDQFGGDDQEQGQVDEEEYVQTRNISMSRWASNFHSPREISLPDDEDMPRREEKVHYKNSSESILDSKRSSPECGEFCSLGPSSEDEYFENKLEEDDVMDVDKTHDENAVVSELDVEVDGDSRWMEEPSVPTQRRMSMLQGSRSVFEYEKLNKIDAGTYGIVYRARDKKTGEIVALKKVKMDVGKKDNSEDYGFPLSSLREINLLLSFQHPSIVNVKEVVMDDLDSVFIVMEYMEHDLRGLLKVMKQPFSTSEVKCLMLQLLEGVKYLHDNWVLHRDLKTLNLLLNNRGELKVCDFGLSRQYGSPLKPYTLKVVTQLYRAPELLLGTKLYSTAIDMWSVGCIMAEFLSKEPLFMGTSEIDQLDKIFKTLGTPNDTIWPGLSQLPGLKANFVKQPYNLLRKKFPATSFTGSPVLSDLGFDLLNGLLTYDPEKRITADAALNHDWFREVPLPKSKEFMPTFPPKHAQNR